MSAQEGDFSYRGRTTDVTRIEKGDLCGGGTVSQQEVAELVAYARDYGFEVIPEIQSLSHTEDVIVRISKATEKNLEHIPLVMVREDLSDLPLLPLPQGFRLRYYRRGEDRLWVDIWISVGSFGAVDRALAYFEDEFGPGRDEVEARCLFLEDENGLAIGTSTAWYNSSFNGKEYGRIHWIAICPEYQGRKLARPLLGASLKRLADLHERAYLTTQTTSARAVNLYLDFGFVPFARSERRRRGWQLLASLLDHPALEAYRT